MPEVRCPRCGSADVVERVCQSCRIAYDSDKAFEPHTREHTMIAKRWVNWTLEKRSASQRAIVRNLMGGI